MTTIDDLCRALEEIAPLYLAADWDNVGLLVGDHARPAQRVMTCLTVTPATAAEAIRERADLIVTHHPLPFHPLRRIVATDTAGRMLLELIQAKISVYSAHTAYDSAVSGINQELAEKLGLVEIEALEPPAKETRTCNGRRGRFSRSHSLSQVADQLKTLLHIGHAQVVGKMDAQVQRVAIACGSGGEFLEHAARAGCHLFITGEARFHTSLEAEARGIAMLLTGHYASERFGVESLVGMLALRFPDLTIWASRDERDPLALT